MKVDTAIIQGKGLEPIFRKEETSCEFNLERFTVMFIKIIIIYIASSLWF